MHSSRSGSVADIAIRERGLIAPAAGGRSKVLDRLRLGDAAFRQLTRAAAIGVLVLLSAVIISLIRGSIPALKTSGETAPLLFTSLNNQFWSTNLNAPISSLPVVIFQFALSPYKDWQALAWTGALIITMAVLALSISARALVATGKQS